jgi:hypothetical protein
MKRSNMSVTLPGADGFLYPDAQINDVFPAFLLSFLPPAYILRVPNTS